MIWLMLLLYRNACNFCTLLVFVRFVKDQVVVDMLCCLQGLCSVPFVYISVLVRVPCCFGYYSLVVSLKSGSVMPPALFFLLRIVLAMWALFRFHKKFKVVSASSVKKVNGSMMGIALNL